MGRIDAMEWLLSHRYVKHPNMVIFAAVEKDRLDVVTLDDTEQRREGFTIRAVNDIDEETTEHICEWLIEHYGA
ncbi:hypothetical protein PRNP1_014461 [Phytophthora ramorum]